MIRHGIVKNIQDILNSVDTSWTQKDFKDKVPGTEQEILGQKIKMFSDRYKVFKNSCTCVECGIEGAFFALERSFQPNQEANPHYRYHMNLYAIKIDDDGEEVEVLMTKDHIVPRAKGGKDNISNYQTMCTTCNQEKGSN